ncbi:MAG: thioredoxin-disulfide reductase [Actinomycetota bacterium]|nr:thioredoxin-disulfide reductase [Actinomycetota bacterium]
MSSNQDHTVIIIGSGPAGLTAALYAARANLSPLVIEGFDAGGQLMLTTGVENFPGFVDPVMGPELMDILKKQAGRFGTTYLQGDVSDVDFSERPLKVMVGENVHTAEAVIVATGASARMLGLEKERSLMGRGVSTCATCDGAFFRNQRLLVVGGGDSAMEEATFLTRFAEKVTVLHRRSELRASKIMQERAFSNPKIDFIWNVEVVDLLGDQAFKGAVVKDTQTGETREVEAQGFFLAIGHDPNTSLLKGKLELDDEGYLRVGRDLSSDWGPDTNFSTRTSVEGVFGAGDVVDHVYRQAVTAAGMGCMAAMDAERWLEGQGR